MRKRCILIPAYNEAKNIAAVIAEIRAHVRAIDIIVIDDGSTDDTAVCARRADAYVIRHPFNLGYGAALQTGYKYALQNHYDLLVQIDGDGQHVAGFIPEMFRRLEACDVVIGSRFLESSRYRTGTLKLWAIRLFRWIIRITTGEQISDPTSGYQGLNRQVIEFFADDDFPWDYPDANVIIMLHRAGFRIAEISADMRPNPEARAMHRGILKITYYFFKVFMSIFITLIRRSKSTVQSLGG